MKQIYISGIKAKGFYHNNIKYSLSGGNPQLKKTYTITATSQITTSAAADQTSGYLHTITVDTTKQFRLFKYNDLVNPLTSVPNGYKFVLKNVTDTVVSGISLVYDGNYLFHISGSLTSNNTYYEHNKTATTTACIVLVDTNGNNYLSDVANILNDTRAASSTSTNYTESTLTYTNNTSSEFEDVLNITLPYKMEGTTSSIIPTSMGEYYPVASVLRTSSITVTGQYLL